MSIRALVASALAAVACAQPPGSLAQQPKGIGDAAPVAASEVRAWLMRIHDAASRRNFTGTFVVSGGGAVSSARIAHFCEGRDQFERSESLDGQARHVYRHNEWVYTVWPSTKVALLEQRDVPATFPALLQAGDDHIVDFYDVSPERVDRVAGHEADVLFVKPKDGVRYGYRLWSDRASGLLLRADVIGAQGDVLETSAFSDVAIGVKPQPESVLQPIRKLDGYRLLRPSLTTTRLDVEGWAMVAGVPGFRQVSCVKRRMDGGGSGKEREGAGNEVLQTIFSDGLTYVSVFIEPFNPARHVRPMSAAVGATQTMTSRQGEWWMTVIGDVPPATLRMFADGLQRKR